jgi:tRNA (guanine26-N2/guanine27-N2)-dimethyltransferase
MEVDKDNMIKGVHRGKRQANEVNETRGAVFYNPVQEFNRDFSIFAINEFNELVTEERAQKGKDHDGITVLEALAATGLRSVRYAKEIPSIKKLVANDILPAATDLMKKNFEFNDCDKDKIEVHTADAIDLMHGMRA